MPRKKLSSLFASTAKKTSRNRKCDPPQPVIETLKKSVNPLHLFNSSLPSSSSGASGKPARVSPDVSKQVLSRLKEATSRNSKAYVSPDENLPTTHKAEESDLDITKAISSLLDGDDDTTIKAYPSSQASTDGMLLKNILDVPWFSDVSEINKVQWKKEVSRVRKQKYIFKNVESRRFVELVEQCAQKLGTEPTLEFFGRFGREMGVKEYNTLIRLCINKASNCSNEEDALVHVNKAYGLFLSMRDKGLQIEEESYGQLLIYMIDMKLVQGFQMFSEFLKNENPKSSSRIGYYEMLLWIKVGNEDKIQQLFDCVNIASTEDNYALAESYLLAFCKTDRKKELLQLLEALDIRKILSSQCITDVFKSVGRLQLETLAEKFLLEFNAAGAEKENISLLIYEYATCVPKLAVEDIVPKFINFHQKLGIVPSIESYEKLITLSCNLDKVHVALDIVDHMCKSGFIVPIEVLNPVLQICEQQGKLEMVHNVYSIMRQHNFKPKGDTFKIMISLLVKMKDFEGAYNLLTDVVEMNEMPTACMYNIILAGYFREKNNRRALMVLKQMEDADVKPNSETFSYLIANCKSEEDIVKYCDEMCNGGVEYTKYVYMSLINAYANFGNFEMAKQIVLDKEIQSKYLNEIKSVLVSALASNGQIHDALSVYAEIKQTGSVLDPKAAICLIEHLQTEGVIDRLLQILEELKDSNNWFDGCSRVVLYCVQFNLLGTAIVLLKELKEKDKSSAYLVIDQVFSQIWKTTPTNLKFGLEILQAVKEDLDLHPSRTSLDFLLSACVKAKDSQTAQSVWSEYGSAGLPYNVLTFVRMYQALLASGESGAAKDLLKQIPKNDSHVRCLIKSCKMTYFNPRSNAKAKDD